MPPGVSSKDRAAEVLPAGLCRLTELQDQLYAADRWALLVIFQAMNAAGKDKSRVAPVFSEALPHSKWNSDSEVVPQYLAKRAKEALPGGRCQRAATRGRLDVRL